MFDVTNDDVLARTTVQLDSEENGNGIDSDRLSTWIREADSMVYTQLGQVGIVTQAQLSNIEEGKRGALKALVINCTLSKLYAYLKDIEQSDYYWNQYYKQLFMIKRDPAIFNEVGADMGTTQNVGEPLDIYSDGNNGE